MREVVSRKLPVLCGRHPQQLRPLLQQLTQFVNRPRIHQLDGLAKRRIINPRQRGLRVGHELISSQAKGRIRIGKRQQRTA